MKIENIEFESISYCKPIEGLCKQYGVWLNGIGGENVTGPLAYFQKPKWIKEKQFIAIMKKIGLIED
jgi:hypothetical protein